ncbi:hypothetical protein IV203_033202 [Nitzschia inconspicua]|uniref:Uncharacterized protein n=1 Tax=Nitzschia inconspicua TaxID=303405 RepID=A0A9K3PGB1_9STRA|nr:hypothetical protein IV203_033202 [Nitzschia inconspicua]
MPKPLGKPLVMRLFVDSDHAADKMVRRSRTGFILYLNNAPIVWYSKRQGTIETSVFGAEFIAMRTGFESARGLRYKLRMMGIEVGEPAIAMGEAMTAHIRSEDNPADICTKLIPGGMKRDRTVSNILYYSKGSEDFS